LWWLTSTAPWIFTPGRWGLKLIFVTKILRRHSRDGYTLHLKSGNPAIEERANKRENEHLDLSFSVEDIQGFFESIKNPSVTIVQPLQEMPYGREFYIANPDGYILGFLE
jgi:hypothetical protein